jgi:hypothetical protein
MATPWHERADAVQTLILVRWHWSALDVLILLALRVSGFLIGNLRRCPILRTLWARMSKESDTS